MRALLGGWNAWLSAGGATEPVASANATPVNQTQQVAAPNPSIKEVEPTDAGTTKTLKGTPIKPDTQTQQAPMQKTTKSKSKNRSKTKRASAPSQD